MCPERQSIHICGHVTCDHVARARCSPTKWFSNEFNRNYKNKFIAPAAAAGGGEDGGEDGGEVPARHLKRRKTSAAGFFGEDDDEAGAEEEVPEEDELKAYLPGDAPDQVQVREGCHQLVARAPGQVPKLGRHGSAVLRLPCQLSLGRAPLLPSRHCILSEASVC